MLQGHERNIPAWLTLGLVPSIAVSLLPLPTFVPITALLHCPWWLGTFVCGALNHFHAQGLSPGHGESSYHGYLLLYSWGKIPAWQKGCPTDAPQHRDEFDLTRTPPGMEDHFSKETEAEGKSSRNYHMPHISATIPGLCTCTSPSLSSALSDGIEIRCSDKPPPRFKIGVCSSFC